MKPADNMLEQKPAVLSTMGERIKAVRLAWKWAQEDMADILRVDQASISFWERDKIKPSGSALLSLAALFRTTVSALENGENFAIPTSPNRGEDSRKSKIIPRGVCLPICEQAGKITIVDFADGGVITQPLSEAMINLGQYSKDNRKIWIVVE
ncbi:MAG: helix-turn-helix domain-containing protein [Holophagaceae bacterium]|nr:helix-turn-helix domain-containing protein [Holophagaceae bacterium]